MIYGDFLVTLQLVLSPIHTSVAAPFLALAPAGPCDCLNPPKIMMGPHSVLGTIHESNVLSDQWSITLLLHFVYTSSLRRGVGEVWSLGFFP